jgi:hypothetical protein
VEHANGMILQDLKLRIFNELNKFNNKMAYRALLDDLEFEDDPEAGYVVHAILSSLWNRCCLTHILRT